MGPVGIFALRPSGTCDGTRLSMAKFWKSVAIKDGFTKLDPDKIRASSLIQLDTHIKMTDIQEESKTPYNFLGKSGLKVSNICLGTMTFGESKAFEGRSVKMTWKRVLLGPVSNGIITLRPSPNQATEEVAHRILDRYVEWGGNFLDTADVYTNGESETIIGTWLKKQNRESIVVATKVRFATGKGPNGVGLSRRHITSGVEHSLERLSTDYIDLYQIHRWDAGTPLEETLRTLDDLVRCGKVRYIGGSNLKGWQMQSIASTTQNLGLNPFVSLQQQYSLLCRGSELESFPVCKINGVGVLPWSPLKGGFLTGKYSRKSSPEQGRIGHQLALDMKEGKETTRWDKMAADDRTWQIMEKLEKIAADKGKTQGQVALRWLLQKDVVVSPIIGATTLEQLDSNMAAATGWSLTPEEMDLLDEVSTPELSYPYEVNRRLTKGRDNPFNQSFTLTNTF